ncbi:unnamed protein product [Lactuca virosa]|uniref:Uncharacterized protein n=1 Tax=Lactuca virosa TaxID=75947 RepID=A0AAU9M5C2_9ASTR|nr:unnamed protein product [Lactuca virosa]
MYSPPFILFHHRLIHSKVYALLGEKTAADNEKAVKQKKEKPVKVEWTEGIQRLNVETFDWEIWIKRDLELHYMPTNDLSGWKNHHRHGCCKTALTRRDLESTTNYMKNFEVASSQGKRFCDMLLPPLPTQQFAYLYNIVLWKTSNEL